jgi:serine/threonine protein kinase
VITWAPLTVNANHDRPDGGGKGVQLAAGSRFGDFELIRPLGSGGMGEVWEATQISVGRRVALKLLPPVHAANPVAVKRFKREAVAGGRLKHAHIAAVYAAGFEEGQPYLAQELVEGGRTLAHLIAETRDLARVPAGYDERVARIVATIADALEFAHRAGVIHRDVKPGNVLVGPDGEPKLVDFGLARIDDGLAISRSGELTGTCSYMSPEQIRASGAEVDHRTDVFSLGTTLYELLALRRAFDGDSIAEVTDKILRGAQADPREFRPEAPAALVAVCLRAMQKEPGARYETAGAMAAELRAILDGGPPPVEDGPAHDSSRPRIRPALIVALSIVAALALWGGRMALENSAPSLDRPRSLEAGHPWRELPNFPELARYSAERVAEYARRPGPAPKSTPTRERLAALVLPSVLIQPTESLKEALSAVPELAAFSVFVHPSAENAALGQGTVFGADLRFPIRADQLLDLLLFDPLLDVAWGIEQDRLVVRTADRLVDKLVPEVHPVLDLTYSNALWNGISSERLVPMDIYNLTTLIQESVGVGTWEEEGVSIDSSEGVLVVYHEPWVQRGVASFLCSLRRSIFEPVSEPWLTWDSVSWSQRPMDVDLLERLRAFVPDGIPEPGTEQNLEAFFVDLEVRIGVDIVVDGFLVDGDEIVTLDIPGLTAAQVLNRALGELGYVWTTQYGCILVSDNPRDSTWLEGRMYPLWDLTWLPTDPVPAADGLEVFEELDAYVVNERVLEDLIINSVAPESWDAEPRYAIRTQGSILFVVQSPEVQDQVAEFLARLRRAMK